jgi:hypothetical protein
MTTIIQSDPQFALTVAKEIAKESGNLDADSIVTDAEKFLAFLKKDSETT